MPEPIDPFTTEGKGHLAKSNQDRTAAYETGIACLFPTMFGMIPLGFYGQMLSRATGIDDFSDEQYLLRLGERIWNLERLFNLREGFGRGDDTLPRRFTEEPLPEGPRKGHTVDLERMLQDYYRDRGWTPDGNPTEKKLRELGIPLKQF